MILKDIETALRTILIEDTSIQSLLNCDSTSVQEQVRIGHITSVVNPTYPLITFNIPLGTTNHDHYTVDALFSIHAWGKNSVDELIDIYSRIRDLINLNLVESTSMPIAECMEKTYNDNLYENTTRTYHLAASYTIKALNY